MFNGKITFFMNNGESFETKTTGKDIIEISNRTRFHITEGDVIYMGDGINLVTSNISYYIVKEED